jgi:hypothetical protein
MKNGSDYLSVEGNEIHVLQFPDEALELIYVFQFSEAVPAIKVFEKGNLQRTFTLETKTSNPDLSGQFFHCSVRILDHGGIMIDGVLSKSADEYPSTSGADYEGIRFQPFFLSKNEAMGNSSRGQGLFARGLHYPGRVTPGNVRVICICDVCAKSFTLQHFHAGFGELQYFYSSDSKSTLVVPNGKVENIPAQLQQEIDKVKLAEAEKKLPKPVKGSGTYNYYNPLRCPHCNAKYIDFEKFPEMRPAEYYGNTFLNEKPEIFGN